MMNLNGTPTASGMVDRGRTVQGTRRGTHKRAETICKWYETPRRGNNVYGWWKQSWAKFVMRENMSSSAKEGNERRKGLWGREWGGCRMKEEWERSGPLVYTKWCVSSPISGSVPNSQPLRTTGRCTLFSRIYHVRCFYSVRTPKLTNHRLLSISKRFCVSIRSPFTSH